MKTWLLLLSLLLHAPASVAGGALRDPTRPLAATLRNTVAVPAAGERPSAPAVLPQLQLVLVSHDRRYAVIDDELLAEGDAIRGLALLKILDEAVVLKTPNGPRTLTLPVPVEQ